MPQQELSPEAYFDCLAIVIHAPRSVRPITITQAHLFSYLGCVLALFAGKPVADWGYKFAVTKEGFPFSPQFEYARELATRKSLLSFDEDNLIDLGSANKALKEFNYIRRFGHLAERIRWIKLSTECSLVVSVGGIKQAVSGFSSLRAASALRQNRGLLDDDDVKTLYREYEIISEVLENGVSDPLSPAVLWLTARILGEEVGAV